MANQPALLRLIATCPEAGRTAGKPVGVCGGAAADPTLAPVLAGMGVTSLSMAARAVPHVARALASRSIAECEDLARRVASAHPGPRPCDRHRVPGRRDRLSLGEVPASQLVSVDRAGSVADRASVARAAVV